MSSYSINERFVDIRPIVEEDKRVKQWLRDKLDDMDIKPVSHSELESIIRGYIEDDYGWHPIFDEGEWHKLIGAELNYTKEDIE